MPLGSLSAVCVSVDPPVLHAAASAAHEFNTLCVECTSVYPSIITVAVTNTSTNNHHQHHHHLLVDLQVGQYCVRTATKLDNGAIASWMAAPERAVEQSFDLGGFTNHM